MATYGFVRLSPLTDGNDRDSQIAEIERKAEELGVGLKGVFVDPGTDGTRTAILDQPTGKEMLETLVAGDTLIVNRLDRLGYTAKDVRNTLGALSKAGVEILVLHAADGELKLLPNVGQVLGQLLALWAATEKALWSERAREVATQRKNAGLAYCGVPIAKKIVVRNGVKTLAWDEEQLAYIVEIARRLPVEGAAAVAQDFWKRRIKDRRGRLWGKQRPKPKPKSLTIFNILARGRVPHRTPYQQFIRAARWFHRMKHKGLLPPPYDQLALSIPEPKGFCGESKPRKWTRGGTARLKQERAEAKARHRAERLARWQKEKDARLRARVHKPTV